MQYLERASYYGGHTQVFHHGEIDNVPIQYIDIVSMYPSILFDYEMPGSRGVLIGGDNEIRQYNM